MKHSKEIETPRLGVWYLIKDENGREFVAKPTMRLKRKNGPPDYNWHFSDPAASEKVGDRFMHIWALSSSERKALEAQNE